MTDRDDSRRLLDPDTLRRLCRARDLIAARSREAVPLVEAAAAAHLSPFHFQRLFRRAFGESPHRFQTRRRLDLAKQLLARDHLSVTDICFEAGYQSLGSFSAKFSSHVGRAPSEYRRELRRVFGYRAPWRIAFVPVCFFARLSAAGGEGPQEARSMDASPSPILVAERQGDAP